MNCRKYIAFCCPNGPTKNIFEEFLALHMAPQKQFWMVFSCPRGPTKNFFERLLAARMAQKTFLKGF